MGKPMKKIAAILLFTVLAGNALAQPVPSPASSEQALTARLIAAITSAKECSANLIKEQSELSRRFVSRSLRTSTSGRRALL